MSSPSSIPSRRSRDEDDDSDDSESINSSRPTSNKRPRLSEPQSEVRSDEEGQRDAPANDNSERLTQAMASQAVASAVGPGGFKPGAIVRIKVTNFVTYTSAEFFPGPKLNMVIGPNGTGKSTLVCAICLGLGWGPQHLGRAKDLGEFVKHGCREATIEIELAGAPKYRRNPVICRTIKRDGNKSFFTLNTQSVPHKRVMELAKSFAIQVDNLCQFLPQDKVAEFAALTPIELLHSTQRAAAGPEMLEWHDALKKLRAEQKNLELKNRAERELLGNLENRQEMQRADVEQMRQRTVIQRKIELLEMFRPMVEYRDHAKLTEELKTRQITLEREHEELKKELEPALQALTEKENYISRVNDVREHRKHLVQRLSDTAHHRGKRIDDLEGSIKELKGQAEAEKKGGQKHKIEATTVRQKLMRLRREYEEQPVDFDPDHYNEKLRPKRHLKREVETKARELQRQRGELVDEKNRIDSSAEEAKHEMDNLDSQSGRQESLVRSRFRDTWNAYQWVRENQDKFEQEVFGPVAVTCSVTDPKYADAVESLLQLNDFLAFTTQSKNDFRTLQRAFRENDFRDVSIKTCRTPLDSVRAPISNEELRRLGFDGWAMDFLSGPGPVIASLCMENGLNQTPIALRDVSEETFVKLTDAEDGAISSWTSGTYSYKITRRREYNTSSTRSRKINPARFWTSQPVDVSLKRQYEHRIQKCHEEREQVVAKLEKVKKEQVELKEAHDKLQDEMKEIEDEKAEKQSALTRHRALPEQIAQAESKMKSLQESYGQARERVAGIREQEDEIAIKKAEATIEYADAVEELRQAFEEYMQVEMRYLEATSDMQTLQRRNHDYAVMLEQKNAAAKEALGAFKESRQKGKQLYKVARRIAQESEGQEDADEVRAHVNHDEYTINQLNADLESEQARLELTHGGSAHLIKEFEDRERQIQKLHDKLTNFRTQMAAIQEGIDEVRGRWEPRLDALISKISDAFSDSFQRIGCAGQVGLDKVEDESGPDGEPGGSDFEKWSIQIHVKFREQESLSLLDSHRQSGGERAVSTIFYLMALQSLSASPFRVVDEINQGMDPRNERMVHGRLVDIACASETGPDDNGQSVGGGGGGQYFLITPKLLSGLVYKPGMRVLCIYSGEHMPEDFKKLDFGQVIRNMKARAGQSGRSTSKSQDRTIRSNEASVDVYA